MTKPIPLRDFVAGGHVTEETVNAIAALHQGEPIVTEDHYWATTPYRCWTRLRQADGQWTRNLGQYRPTVQEAAEDLLGRLIARAQGREA